MLMEKENPATNPPLDLLRMSGISQEAIDAIVQKSLVAQWTYGTNRRQGKCVLHLRASKNAFTSIITTTNAYTRTVYASACNAFFHTYIRT